LLKEQFFSKDKPETKPQKDFSQVVNLKTLLRRGNWLAVNDYLKTLSPSGVELEFLSLSTFDLDSKDEDPLLSLMLDFFLAQVTHKVDTDFTQAMLNCFLKAHYEVLLEDDEMMEKVERIQKVTEESFAALEALIDHNMCMIAHFTGLQMS